MRPPRSPPPATPRLPRPEPEPAALGRAVALIRSARRPLIVAGGGVIYSEAAEALRAFAAATGILVGVEEAGKGSLRYDDPSCGGAIGATGTTAANALAREADVVIGIGTRWSDFTTASRSAFAADGVAFVNINVAAFDAAKHAGTGVVADARAALTALAGSLGGWRVDPEYRERARRLAAEWDAVVERAYATRHAPRPSQAEILGVVNEVAAGTDIVLTAAGSMPGELHRLWRGRPTPGVPLEGRDSCTGYHDA